MTSNEDAYREIKKIQEALSLPDSDTELVIPKKTKQDQKNLDTYERMMRKMMQDHALTDRDRQELNDIQELLHLREEDVREVEERLIAQQSGQINPLSDSSNALTTPPASGVNQPLAGTPHPNPELSPSNLSGIKGQVLRRKLEMEAAANAPTPAHHEATHPSDTTAHQVGVAPTPDSPQTEPSQTQTEVIQSSPGQTADAQDIPVEQPSTPATITSPETSTEANKPRRDRRPLAVLIGLLAGTLGILGGAWLAASNLRPQSTSEAPKPNPKTAQQYLQSGTKKTQQGQYDAAVKDFDQAIQANPQDNNSYLSRGLAYYQQGNLSAALNDYDKAISLNPKFAEALNNRSHIYYDQRKYDDAQRDAEQAIKLKPGLAEAYINLGNAQFAKGNPTEAQRSFDRAIQLNPIAPHLARAYNDRGNVHAFNKSFDAALRDYDQAIQRDSNYADAFYNRGLAFQQKGDGPAALRDFQAAAKLYREQGKTDLSNKAQRWVDQLQKIQQSTPTPSASPQPGQTAI